MKSWGWIAALGVIVLIVAVSAGVRSNRDPDRSYEHAKAETREAMDATKDYVKKTLGTAEERARESGAKLGEAADALKERVQAQAQSVQRDSQAKFDRLSDQAAQEQQKQVYQQQVEAKLDLFNKQIDALQDQVNRAPAAPTADASATNPSYAAAPTDEAKDALKNMIQVLQNKREDAQRRLGELKAADGPSWQDAKAGLERSLNDLESAFNQTRAQVESRT